MALAIKYAAPPTAIKETARLSRMASTAAAPRSALPTIPNKPVRSNMRRVNLSIRVAVVGPAGPMTSSRTASTGPT